MPITAYKGTVDILPAETPRWRQVEEVAHRVAGLFGYKEIRTPAFEVTELFTEALGEDSDIIEKELYTFRDKSGRSLTLRPEMTVPTVRAYLEHNLGTHAQLKSYYVSDIWRYERQQPGRMREATQFGVEAIGSPSPAVDAELVDLAMTFFQELGLKDLRLEVNSIGCRKCRPSYQAVLKDFFLGKDDVLCQDCERRKEKNPLRVLDCKKDTCLAVTNTAPTIFQSLCTECKTHFFTFKEHLTQMGYAVHGNPRVVQGLNYYTRTVFQIHSQHLGALNALCSGGRFDELIGHLGSSGAPAIGFAIGIERTIAAMEKEELPPVVEPRIDAFLVGVGDEAERIMTRTMHLLRRRGYRVERDYTTRGVKNQLKLAEKLQPAYTVVVGEEDTRVTQVVVQDNLRGSQENISAGRLVDALEYRLRRDARESAQKRPARGDERREDGRGRDRDRGRGRDEGRGRDRGRDRVGREDLPRERVEEGEEGPRFAEWAATYAEAARSSQPRPARNVPVSELAAQPPGIDDGHQIWAAAQTGLAESSRPVNGAWPAEPIVFQGEPPPRRPAPVIAQNVTGNWLVEVSEGGSAEEEEVVFAPAAGFDAPRGSEDEDSGDNDGDNDDGDDDEGDDEDGEGGDLAGAAAGNGQGEKRRRSRRGGRRHGRRRTKGGRG